MNPPGHEWFRKHKGRSLSDYNRLLECDIRSRMTEGGVWMDLGTDCDAKALRALSDINDIELLAVSSIDFKPPNGVRLLRTVVPDLTSALREYICRITFATDVFGPLSFVEDPLSALLFAGVFLAQRGEFRGITERDRFGNDSTLSRIRGFFADYLHQDLTYYDPRYPGMYVPTESPYLRLVITQTGDPVAKPLLHLIRESRRSVGVPHPRRVLCGPPNIGVPIWQVDYVLDVAT